MNNRYKNPWFWIGLVGVILTAVGVEPSTLATWDSVWGLCVEAVSNPFMLATVTMAVLGVFVDPTTKGLGDK